MADAFAENRINLAAVQRFDRFIKQIKATSKQTTLYTFKSETEEWEKTEIDGACFVYLRSAPPYHGFMILNRVGIENFIQPLTHELEFQRKDPFLLYRSPHAIYGIWFYDPSECEALGDLLTSLVKELKTEKAEMERMEKEQEEDDAMKAHGQPFGGSDILQLLSKAQIEYNKRSEPPAVTSTPNDDLRMVKPQPVKPADGGKSINVEDLFKNASLNAKQVPDACTDDSNKGHAFKRFPTVSELEKEHQVEPQPVNELITPASLTAVPSLSSSAPTASLLDSPVVNRTDQVLTPSKDLSSAALTHTLMSPLAFTVSGRDSTAKIPVAINPPQHVAGGAEADFGFPSSPPSQSGSRLPTALTKDQLKQALEHLLKTDDQFMVALHRAYVDSLNASFKS